MNNERSQATLLMVLGFAILILSGLFFILTAKSNEKVIITQTTQTETAQLEVARVEQYIQGCVDQAARAALDLLGLQGGMIYKEQGGPIFDPLPQQQGQIVLEHDNYLVAYQLYPPRFVPFPFATTVPDFPHPTFPYLASPDQQNFTGYYGLTTLPPLYSRDGPNSFEFQLTHTVTNKTTMCSDFSIFEEEGIEFVTESVSTTVDITNEEVKFTVLFPLTMINTITDERAEMERFTSTQAVRLGNMHRIVSSLLDLDRTNINYSLASSRIDSEYTIQLLEDIYEQDSLLIVKDTESQIRGRGYEFRVGLHNRPPALFFINSSTLLLPAQSAVTESLLTTTIGLPEALDPDDDELSFSYVFPQLPHQPNVSAQPVLVGSDTPVQVRVSDGQFTDHQELTIETYLPNEDNQCIERKGCYDVGGNLIASRQMKHSDFSHYLEQNACESSVECLCPADLATTKSTVEDPDDTRAACFCIRGSEWTGSSCCGDDVADCGSITNGWLCAINKQHTESSLYSVSRDKNRVVHLGCSERSVVSDGRNWHQCTAQKVQRVSGSDLACAPRQNKLRWHECCGTGPCRMNGDHIPLYVGDTVTINNQRHYCSSTRRFTTNPGINRATCEASGNRWTGTFCCQAREYYADTHGCWNGQAITSSRLMNSKVYFVNGDFRGCQPTSSQTRIRDAENGRQLIDSYPQCTLPNNFQYFCSPSGRWLSKNLHYSTCLQNEEPQFTNDGDELGTPNRQFDERFDDTP